MAATYAECEGIDSSRRKVVHRLGSREAIGRAQTWRTFATCHVDSDGRCWVHVKRDGVTLLAWEVGPE